MSSLTLPLQRLISGPKARFVQDGVDLDLSYITDRLIIMAFPASGVATLWRNSRKVVRAFLDERHGEHWRVYNFCPRGENEYDGEEFYGRGRSVVGLQSKAMKTHRELTEARCFLVSRYPFPDHHVPLLSLIPMVVTDLTAWFAEHPQNVAVIHCKAGKDRSGTLACCYLISLPKLPPPPQDPRNHTRANEKVIGNGDGARNCTSHADGHAALPEREREEERENNHLKLGSLANRSRSPKPSLRLRAQRSLSAMRSLPSLAWDEAGPKTCPSLGFLRRSFFSSANREPSSIDEATPPLPARAAQTVRQLAGMGSASDSADSSITGAIRDLKSGQELVALQDKLEAVFDLHTSRRLKPEKAQRASKPQPRDSPSVSRRSTLASRVSWTSLDASLPVRPSAEARHSVRRAAASSTPCLIPCGPRLEVNPPSPFLLPMDSTEGLISSDMTEELSKSSTPPTLHRNSRLAFAIPASPSRRKAHLSSLSSDEGRRRDTSSPFPVDPRPRHLRSDTRLQDQRSALGITPLGKSSEALSRDSLRATSGSSTLSVTVSPSGSGGLASKNSSRQTSIDLATWGRKSIEALRFSSPYTTSVRQRSSSALTSSSDVVPDDDDDLAREVRWPSSNRGKQDPNPSRDDDACSTAATAIRPKRLGVSIASQRRWVGYWARMLNAEDARATMDYLQPSSSRRLVRITSISILQDIKLPDTDKKGTMQSLAKLDSYHISLGRYQNSLVDKVEGWERGARRRARAFGMLDPGARAPEIFCGSGTPKAACDKGHFDGIPGIWSPPSCVPGEERWQAKQRLQESMDGNEEQNTKSAVRLRSRRPSSADWRQCATFNTSEGVRRRLAQHGNDVGVGEWGINVASEAERCRRFDWPDEHEEGPPHHDKDGSGRGFRFIEWGPKIKQSTPELASSEDSPTPCTGIWHHFDLSKRPQQSDESRDSGWASGTNALHSSSSPPTPPRSSSGEDVMTEDASGLLVSPDREFCVKVHLANKAFTLFPDTVGPAGWVWFIPAFEDPSSQCQGDTSLRPALSKAGAQGKRRPVKGSRTIVEFNRDEIDFVKRIAGVKAIRVEWEWICSGDSYEEDDDDDKDDDDDEV